ncbi:MAG: molybdopterin-dependent oxidoreductase [Raoultibacter sp.]
MGRAKKFVTNRKVQLSTIALTIAIFAMAGCAQSATVEGDSGNTGDGTTSVNYAPEGRYKDGVAGFPATIDPNLDEKNAEKNAPRSYVDRNGFTVQPVPNDDIGWNISYLNADNRGCTSCHTLEDSLMMMDTYHGTIFNGYPTEMTVSTCFTCHIWAEPLKVGIHGTHMGNDLFENKGGTCDSCHSIDENGDFKRWDYEKFNLYKGITDIAANEADLSVAYDQTTTTSVDDMFYKSIKQYGDFDERKWRTDDSNLDPDLYKNWVFSVGGDVENPINMTLPELVDKFGTVTSTMKQQCTINGIGNAVIMQNEVTGVSMQAIIDYVKPKGDTNAVEFLTEDPYPNVGKTYNIPFKAMVDNDSILVLEVDGETLPNTQGYPCSVWTAGGSAAGGVFKVCTGVNFIKTDEASVASGYFLGGFEDAGINNAPADKPNSAVLNYPSGVVLEGAAGKELSLEGFADAFDEPIKKVEFSWDHGVTWTTLETPKNDPQYWTYWRMKFTPPETGAYLLDIRTTSITPEGAERVSAVNTQFLLNVK